MSETPRKGPTPIEETLDIVLRELGVRQSPTEARVFAAFGEAAGPALRGCASTTRYQRGELLVEVRSAAQLHELANFTGAALRERINDLLGGPVVKNIVFKHQAG